MNKKLIRALCLILCAVMVLGLLPAIAFAAEAESTVTVVTQAEDGTYYRRETTSQSAAGSLPRTASELIPLGTPTDPQWGIYNSDEMPGAISWATAEPDQGNAWIQVYREGDTDPYASYGWSFGSTYLPERRYIDSFCLQNPESGTYYFTVQSEGDNTAYCDSEILTSGTWTYTKPSARLDTCSGLTWNWPQCSWTAVTGDHVDGYEVEWYFVATADDEPRSCGGSWSRGGADRTTNSPWDELIQENGIGYYYFRVRALSDDITAACNGEWSELSEPFNLTELSLSVEEQLEEITTGDPDEIRSAVQAMDTQELKSAMLADQDNTGATAQIAALEETAGGSAAIEVADNASAFDASQVSIVGANLNTPTSDANPITLVIDKPEKTDVIPAAYDNAVAVRFSMTLDNVADPENLEVPVKITLPVPASINPSFLVILHYHAATGEVEEIRPWVYQENGQYYAAFVLTSFSDFVMTQLAETSGNPFVDVPQDSYYYDAALWAADLGITAGYGSAETFCPDLACTRAQVVTFLWRAAGEPVPRSSANPFVDVVNSQNTSWYYTAVLWAAEEGITAGYGSDTTFCPDQECSRAEIVTFLHRYAGTPAPASTNNPFVDVPAGEWYTNAVLWAVEEGITNGLGSTTTFCPNSVCNRAQIVTFLYRAEQ